MRRRINLSVFSISSIQTCIQILRILKRNNIDSVSESITELEEYVFSEAPGVLEYQKQQAQKKKVLKQEDVPYLCDVCQSPMSAASVNVSPCTQVSGGWKTVLVCTNADCMSIKYLKEPIHSLIEKELIEKVK